MLKFVKRAEDLISSPASVAEGFLRQANEKVERADPFIADALKFRRELARIMDVETLLRPPSIREDLVSAGGFSEKSLAYIDEDNLKIAMRELFGKVMQQHRSDWREHILYRYLLTKGDSLGGAMRNWGGAVAQAKFTDVLVIHLIKNGKEPDVERAGDEEKIQRILWEGRRLLIDKKSALVGKGVDVILLDDAGDGPDTTLLTQKERYLACGELKGGIDPAGADEHWKTATAAFDRIRKGLTPHEAALFFVGAAIETDMAKEIFSDLQAGKLRYAANLNSDDQLNDLAGWLVSI